MVWQEIYGTMRDSSKKEATTTSSRRGINDWIAGEIETAGKSGWSWETDFEEEQDNCPACDLRKIKKKYRELAKKVIEEVKEKRFQETMYRHRVTFGFASDQEYFVNGIKITQETLNKIAEAQK
ncbi:hypothetical protein GOV10_03015 [Candidatus Woesearchaeota archaeon]|nr:hypothetical protein [Candidatus Woesearchaeota archaeon]